MEKKFLSCLGVLRGEGDLDSALHDADFVAGHIQAWGGIFLADAGGDMKFPAMPWTGNVLTFYGAFP